MINLRDVRFDDHWRRALRRQYSFQLNKITFNGESVLDGLSIDFGNGLSGVVGKNGIGKSNLIRTLFNALHNERSNRGVFETPIMNNVSLETIYKLSGVDKSATIDFQENKWADIEPEISSFIFDPCNLIPELQDMLIAESNLDELLEGHGETVFGNDELQLINYITSSNYESVTIVLIEDEYDKFPLLPFFKVKKGGVEYDSRTMGLGELSLFYFVWLFIYLSKLQGKLFYFIEEPESFIPPAAQKRLMNVLAFLCSEHSVPVFVLSHSEHILDRIPRSNIFILRGDTIARSCQRASDDYEHLRVLGLTASKRGIILTEDSAATILFKSIIRYSSKYVVDSFYYHVSGSIGEIIQDLNRNPKSLGKFNFIGMFDGDAQGKAELDVIDSQAKYTFLPSDISPEQFIRQFFDSLNNEEVASMFNVTVESIETARDNIAGLDHHDYFMKFAIEIDLGTDEAFKRICESWAVRFQEDSIIIDFLDNLEAL
jgi:ABC-type multidrug transport system ATPase subunit